MADDASRPLYVVVSPCDDGQGDWFCEIEDADGRSVCIPSERRPDGLIQIGPLYSR